MNTSTTLAQISLPKPLENFKISSPIYLIGGLLALILVLTIFTSRFVKKGKTARGRWANKTDLDNSRKIGVACIGKKAKFNNATYYIHEPIGTPPRQWKNISKEAFFLPQINRGMLVVGGAGSGKTANTIEPAVISSIQQGHSIALFDYKFDNNGLAENLMAVAIDYGYQIRVIAPGSVLSGTFNIHDFIKDSEDLAGAREVVSCIIRNTSGADTKKDAFFDGGGQSILEGAFLMARWIAEVRKDESLANILMVSQILSLSNLSQRLEAARGLIPAWTQAAFSILSSSGGGKEKNNTEGGLLATASKMLSPMIIPNFLSNFSGKSTFPRFDDRDPLKVDGKQMVVFGVNQANEQSTLPLVATALEQIVSYNLKYQRQSPLVVVLDEFPTLNLPVALDWLNRYRSSGCSLILGIQYFGQLEQKYGKDNAQGFLASCATKFWYNPGNPDTAKMISDLLGKQELTLPTLSKSTGGAKGAGVSRSTGTQLHQIALIEPNEPLNFPQGTCIIQCPSIGNKTEIGLPYRHSFKFSQKQNDIYRQECKAKYAILREVGIANKANTPELNSSDLMEEYYRILNALLPEKNEDRDESYILNNETARN
jgi:type IV secretion system protein VirD4